MPINNERQQEAPATLPAEPVISLGVCDQCGDDFPRDELIRYNESRVYCESCYDDQIIQCSNCGGNRHISDMHETGDDSLYCEDCYSGNDEGGGEWPEREYGRGNYAEFQSRHRGAIVRSTRIFSAEIECYAPNRSRYLSAYHALPRHIGATGDGSLNSNGVEFQTPKLKGKKGEETIRLICAVLQETEFRIDRSTGLHVHLDGRGLFPRSKTKDEPTALKQLWIFYNVFEDVLHSFLPTSRRENRYCLPLGRVLHAEDVAKITTLRGLERAWYKETRENTIDSRKGHKYDNSRYSGINLHSLLGAKHLEVRYHSGTLNPLKILYWVNLHLRILDLAAAKSLPWADVLACQGLPLQEKTDRFFSFLGIHYKTRRFYERRQKELSALSNADEGDISGSDEN